MHSCSLYVVIYHITIIVVNSFITSSVKKGIPVSISDLLSVLSFGLACFSAGYAFGKDENAPSAKMNWAGAIRFLRYVVLGMLQHHLACNQERSRYRRIFFFFMVTHKGL